MASADGKLMSFPRPLQQIVEKAMGGEVQDHSDYTSAIEGMPLSLLRSVSVTYGKSPAGSHLACHCRWLFK